MMWRKLLLIDVVLGCVIAIGGYKLRDGWLEFQRTHQTEAVQAEAEKTRSLEAPAIAAAKATDWTDIVSKNVFSFDRNDVDIVAPKAAAPAAPAAG